jgi:hypothetical protein
MGYKQIVNSALVNRSNEQIQKSIEIKARNERSIMQASNLSSDGLKCSRLVKTGRFFRNS